MSLSIVYRCNLGAVRKNGIGLLIFVFGTKILLLIMQRQIFNNFKIYLYVNHDPSKPNIFAPRPI